MDTIDTIKSENVQDYLALYRQYRSYYMAERNIMLTGSAFAIYFVFQRLFATIKKLAHLEDEIEQPGPAKVKSG